MKKYQKTNSGWVERHPLSLSDEEIEILNSEREKSDPNAEDILKIKEKISSSRKSIDSNKETELDVVYNQYKPTLQPGDTYELIAFDINENGKGILNCRVNGEHKQIRF